MKKSTLYKIFGCSVLFSSHSIASDFDIIAHRGASGYLPEHTLEAAALAFAQQPDFIEQDVVVSKDGVPIVLHDIHLETVTDVETVYPGRARSDGRYYVVDFTLAELRRLRIHERANQAGEKVFSTRFQGHRAYFTVATFAEHLELITELNRQFNTNIGVYPEIKSPAWHQAQDIDITTLVLSTLERFNLAGPSANSYIQSFDFNELKRLRNELGYKGKLVLLIGENSWQESSTDFNYIRSEAGMKEVAKYVDGIGPWLGHLADTNALERGTLILQPWLAFAHQQKLIIHPYTFRKDALLPTMGEEQLLTILKDNVKADGVFTDHVPPIKKWLNSRQ
jgi:glycerophosphoryl diester phosphodiesterase